MRVVFDLSGHFSEKRLKLSTPSRKRILITNREKMKFQIRLTSGECSGKGRIIELTSGGKSGAEINKR